MIKEKKFQKNWMGHLWQGRFASFLMDEAYTRAAARDIELNPTKAGLVRRVDEYRWSSAKTHLNGEDDILVKVKLLLEISSDLQGLLLSELADDEYDTFQRHERSGRPLGLEVFLDRLETLTSLILKKQKLGPKKNN